MSLSPGLAGEHPSDTRKSRQEAERVERADRLLYRAKEGGRDRVLHAEESDLGERGAERERDRGASKGASSGASGRPGYGRRRFGQTPTFRSRPIEPRGENQRRPKPTE